MMKFFKNFSLTILALLAIAFLFQNCSKEAGGRAGDQGSTEFSDSSQCVAGTVCTASIKTECLDAEKYYQLDEKMACLK